MLLWPTLCDDLQYRHQTRETGKYYNGAGKPCARGSVLEVLFSDKSYATILEGQSRLAYGLAGAHTLAPGGKKGLWSYVYNEILVPSEKNERAAKGRISI